MAKDTDKDSDSENDGSPILKKLTSKIIMGDTKINARLIPDGKQKLDLYQILGIAGDTKTGSSDYGPWTALLGQFRATNMITGEIFEAFKVLLPAVLSEMILGKMGSQGPDGRGVSFAFIVGIMVDEKSTIGYTYYAKPVIEPGVEDPMQKLIAAVKPPKIKALTHKAAK